MGCRGADDRLCQLGSYMVWVVESNVSGEIGDLERGRNELDRERGDRRIEDYRGDWTDR
jgi:hypothetical protein